MKSFPHEDKLIGRIKKYENERDLLNEILAAYNNFKQNCLKINIINESDLKQVVDHMNDYLNFFSNDKFKNIRNNSQSKIYPSILEEFMHYLFRSIVKEPLVCGTANIPIMTHFKPFNNIIECESYEESLCLETTNADFVIGILKKSKITKKEIICPLVVIENKRYADKPMRRIVENTAMKVKTFSPDCLFLVVLDLLSGFFGKNYYPNSRIIDQIYGLQSGNGINNNNLRIDVVSKLFLDVVNHLNKIQKFISLDERYKRGYMMDK